MIHQQARRTNVRLPEIPKGGDRSSFSSTPPGVTADSSSMTVGPGVRDPASPRAADAVPELGTKPGSPMPEPLLAAVVIARDEAKHIADCLRSLLAAVAPF